MKAHRPAYAKRLSLLLFIVIGILTVIPFHAFLTVGLSSLIGHYTALRLWKEVFLAVGLIVAGIVVVKDVALQRVLRSSPLVWLILAYSGLTLIAGLISWLTGHVTAKALLYGLVINLRFLAWFLVVWVLAWQRSYLAKRWSGLVFWPAAVVCVIGLLQFFVLPYDVLSHFGYSQATIFPYQTVNHNLDYQRVMSTLRGANPLGAYLLVIILLLTATWRRRPEVWRVLLGIAAVITLFLTFSRSAWLGTAAGILVISWLRIRGRRHHRLAYSMLGGVVVLVTVLFIGLRHDAAVQNAIFHTEDKSTITTSSNQGHLSALGKGVKDLIHQPLGRGPGTSGPASIYNNGQGRISENYYLQLGQEVGLLGLFLFLAITFVVCRLLWAARIDPLAFGLLAAGIGLIIVNCLSHAWTDDTLSYLWWGLAAIALAKREHHAKA